MGNSGVTGSAFPGTIVAGDVGSFPTPTISNFPPSTVVFPFTLHLAADPVVQQAHTDAIAAYVFLAAQGPGTVLPADLDGQVLTSGIYSGAASLANNGTLTLNGPGIFIFQVSSTLQMNTGSSVVGTADPCNVYWRVGSSATLLGDVFFGNVFADASITVGGGPSNVPGRIIAGTGPTGAATMSVGGNTVGGCASAPDFADEMAMLEEIERELGRRLRWLRRTRGMSQQALAEACGVCFQQVQKYETARSRLSAPMVWRLAVTLRVDTRFFYDGLSLTRPEQRASRTNEARGVSAPPRSGARPRDACRPGAS